MELIGRLDGLLDRAVLILGQLADRFLQPMAGESGQEQARRSLSQQEIDVMLACRAQAIDQRILHLDQLAQTRHRKPLPFPLRPLPRSAPLGHNSPSRRIGDATVPTEGDSGAFGGMDGVP